jgi:hypothetical protein
MISTIIKSHIEKMVRGIDVEWLDAHKEEAASKIRSSASSELAKIGIEIGSIHITEVLDQYGYLAAVRDKKTKMTEINMKKIGIT